MAISDEPCAIPRLESNYRFFFICLNYLLATTQLKQRNGSI